MSSPPSLLSSLLGLITTATQDLQSELGAAGLPEPWIDHAGLHPWDEETPSKKYWDARRTLISALGMMTAVVQNPREKLVCDGMSHHHPAALNFAVRARIPDTLAGPDVDPRVGLPVDEIARRTGTHPAKTERVLRFLCIYHAFQETSPNVFANNKISFCLQENQPNSGPPIFWGDLAFRSATALSRILREPATAHSLDIHDASFAHIFSDAPAPAPAPASSTPAAPPARITAFDFLARPSSAEYRAAFAKGMVTLEVMNGGSGYLDFDWARWDTEGAIFVEAGASTGHLSLSVLPVVKHANFVNQDRPEVCEEGEKFFAEKNPSALTSGRVVFQPNDFFTGQPVQGAPLYILSNILHDWPDAQGLQILNHIAGAMTSTSRLLVMEIVIVPAISQSRSVPNTNAEGNTDEDDAPWPLLKDYGIVNRYAHHQSMEMLNLFNSLDKTIGEYVALFKQAGLELVHVHRIRKLVSIMEVKKV